MYIACVALRTVFSKTFREWFQRLEMPTSRFHGFSPPILRISPNMVGPLRCRPSGIGSRHQDISRTSPRCERNTPMELARLYGCS